jgi:hypothetical protein
LLLVLLLLLVVVVVMCWAVDVLCSVLLLYVEWW